MKEYSLVCYLSVILYIYAKPWYIKGLQRKEL